MGLRLQDARMPTAPREPVLLLAPAESADGQPLAASLPKVKHRQYLPFADEMR